jgi:hypothetical protein
LFAGRAFFHAALSPRYLLRYRNHAARNPVSRIPARVRLHIIRPFVNHDRCPAIRRQ